MYVIKEIQYKGEVELVNYKNYPYHKFYNNTCVINFVSGGYSWCGLSKKEYLVESSYLDNACRVDVKINNKTYHLPVEKFKEWVETKSLDENYYVPKAEKIQEECPQCGKNLVKRVARRGKNVGMIFVGCSGYPKCTYTKNIDDQQCRNEGEISKLYFRNDN